MVLKLLFPSKIPDCDNDTISHCDKRGSIIHISTTEEETAPVDEDHNRFFLKSGSITKLYLSKYLTFDADLKFEGV